MMMTKRESQLVMDTLEVHLLLHVSSGDQLPLLYSAYVSVSKVQVVYDYTMLD